MKKRQNSRSIITPAGVLALFALSISVAEARVSLESFASLIEELSPTVVNISISQKVSGNSGFRGLPPGIPPGTPFEAFFRDFWERGGEGDASPLPPPSRQVNSLGSGFVIDPDGIIITNNHVIANADEITVNFTDGESLPATLIGRDPRTDLAVIKVKPGKKLAYAKFGDSDKARVGDWVLAVGNPFDLGGTVTAGIISAVNRNINAGPYDSFIQTDAAINRGSSGGPLFNLDGEVIGVNTAIISPSGGSIGIGFAVPASIAVGVIEQLRKYGETRRGWLGVQIQTVSDEIAESLNLSEARGAIVASVESGSPADRAGIEAGDVILQFNGIDVEKMRDLPRIVADTPIGEQVNVIVFRDGEEKILAAVVARLEEGEREVEARNEKKDDSKGEAQEILGLKLSALDDNLRQRYGLNEEAKGVVVVGVAPNSPASEKYILPGALITEVGQNPVNSFEDVKAQINKARDEGRRSVLMKLESEERARFVALRLDDIP